MFADRTSWVPFHNKDGIAAYDIMAQWFLILRHKIWQLQMQTKQKETDPVAMV
jgi:hypothetical protein